VSAPGLGIALACAAVLIAGVASYLLLGDDDPAPAGPAVVASDARPATEPFAHLTETTIVVGDEELRVVIADDESERYEGLRRRESIGPYDGMLFVYDDSSARSFTMATVPIALDIGFYDVRGRVVNRLRMEPCPSGNSCPSYLSERPFRYALETLAGELPEGTLGTTR
jgi:uncharacterized membrane protein (UPF0127 family)